jgi:hypothetical protein
MRRMVVAMVCLALVAGFSATAGAVGLQAVGKEQCNCSPLVARGIIPDTMNQIHDALYFPTLMGVLDHVAVDVRTLVEQIGSPEVAEAEAPPAKEEIKQSTEKARSEEKVEKSEKTGKEEKAIKEQTKRNGKKKPVTHAKKPVKKAPKVKVPDKVQ